MDTADSDSAAAASLEATLGVWEASLGRLEQQAAQVLRAAKQLRKAAQDGALATAGAARTALRDSAAKLTDTIARDAEVPAIDIPAAFENGSFLTELSAAADAPLPTATLFAPPELAVGPTATLLVPPAVAPPAVEFTCTYLLLEPPL